MIRYRSDDAKLTMARRTSRGLQSILKLLYTKKFTGFVTLFTHPNIQDSIFQAPCVALDRQDIEMYRDKQGNCLKYKRWCLNLIYNGKMYTAHRGRKFLLGLSCRCLMCTWLQYGAQSTSLTTKKTKIRLSLYQAIHCTLACSHEQC